MTQHNDIERLIDETIRREKDMDDVGVLYLEAEDRDLEWIGESLERAVNNHHQADSMLDAALDEVFESTFCVLPACAEHNEPQADKSVTMANDDPQEFQHWYRELTGCRVAELCVKPEALDKAIAARDAALPGAIHNGQTRASVARALGCPVDKLCRARDGSWTMR